MLERIRSFSTTPVVEKMKSKRTLRLRVKPLAGGEFKRVRRVTEQVRGIADVSVEGLRLSRSDDIVELAAEKAGRAHVGQDADDGECGLNAKPPHTWTLLLIDRVLCTSDQC